MDKRTGKKCIMLGARELTIVWGDTSSYWAWQHHPDSRFKSIRVKKSYNFLLPILILCLFNVGVGIRFAEVAVLLNVWWLEMRGRISCRILSPKTTYAVYFVFNMEKHKYGFDIDPADAIVGIIGTENLNHRKIVCLDLDYNSQRLRRLQPWGWRTQSEDMSRSEQPKKRHDGWFEIELGEFGSCDGDDEVEISLMEVKGNSSKGGLVVEGIEIRPKHIPVV